MERKYDEREDAKSREAEGRGEVYAMTDDDDDGDVYSSRVTGGKF